MLLLRTEHRPSATSEIEIVKIIETVGSWLLLIKIHPRTCHAQLGEHLILREPHITSSTAPSAQSSDTIHATLKGIKMGEAIGTRATQMSLS